MMSSWLQGRGSSQVRLLIIRSILEDAVCSGLLVVVLPGEVVVSGSIGEVVSVGMFRFFAGIDFFFLLLSAVLYVCALLSPWSLFLKREREGGRGEKLKGLESVPCRVFSLSFCAFYCCKIW